MKQILLKIKPIISVLLIFCLSMGGVAGCTKETEEQWISEVVWEDSSGVNSGTNTNDNNDITSTNSGSISEVQTNSKNPSKKDEPTNDVDVSGYTFNLYDEWLPTKITKTSTTFEKMLFQRIEEVEKELGCTIKITNNFCVGMDRMSPMILAGKKVADIIAMMPRQMTTMAGNNYIVDLNKVNGININDEKWVSSYTNVATINGKTYGLSFTKPTEVRFCVVFNKTLLKNNGVNPDEIYQLVRDKKWTFAKFAEYAKKATTSVNGVTKTWGVGGQPKYVTECFLGANNANLVTLSGGTAKATFTSAASIDAISFFDKLVNTDKSFMTTKEMRNIDTFNSGIPDYTQTFLKGTLAFLIEDSWVVNQKVKLKVKNFDWGIVPLPMGPNATDYVSPAGNANLYCITSTNTKDLAKTVKIFNALAQPPKGYDNGDWWLDEIQEDYFQSNDKDSLEMYKLCLSKSKYDVGIGVESLFEAFMSNGVNGPIFYGSGNTIKSGIQSISGTYDKAISSTFSGILSKK